MSNDFKQHHGRDGLMIIAAVRYCLGRRTYIVNDCADWIITNWADWPDNVKSTIKRDVEEEFERLERIPESKCLGDSCDVAAWLKVRDLWNPRS